MPKQYVAMVDDTIVKPDGWDYQKDVYAWVFRLLDLADEATLAAHVPRRLGAEASREELADDKFYLRRLRHLLRSSAHSWANCLIVMPTERRWEGRGSGADRVGAVQRDWVAWADDFALIVESRATSVITHLANDNMKSEANVEFHKKSVLLERLAVILP